MRSILALVLLSALSGGCASFGPQEAEKGASAGKTDVVAAVPDAKSDEEPQRGFLGHVLMYLPNRVLDLFDVVRFGVEVGPGFGVDAAATEYAQAQAWSTLSVGVGFQTLRDPPVQFGGETGLGVGPVGGIVGSPLPWSRSDTAVRLGLHVLIVGGHVSVDPVELLDVPLGFFLVDINDDDL